MDISRQTRIIFLLYTLLFSVIPDSFANSYQDVGVPIVNIYPIEAHQSGQQIWWTTQLDDGRMAFGTANGLTVFDGHTWRLSPVPNNTRVRALHQWHDGRLYAGGINQLGYFSEDKTGGFSFHLIESDHLVPDFGETFSVTGNSQYIIYQAGNAMLAYDGVRLSHIATAPKGRYRVYEIDDQFYFKPYQEDSLFQLTMGANGDYKIAKTEHKLPGCRAIQNLFINRAGQRVAFCSTGQAFNFDTDEQFQIASTNSIPLSTIYSATQGSDGYYYVASSINGLGIYSEQFEFLRHYQQKHGIGMQTAYHVFVDRQETIWLAGLPSISSFAPPHKRSRFTNDTQTNDLENVIFQNDTLYFSGTGIYQLTANSTEFEPPQFEQVDDFNEVTWSLLNVEDKMLSASSNGVFAFDIASSGKLSSPQQLVSAGNANMFTHSADGNTVYASTFSGIIQLEKQNGHWSGQYLPDIEDQFNSIAIDIQASSFEQHVVWAITATHKIYRITIEKGDKPLDERITTEVFKNTEFPLGNEHIRPYNTEFGLIFGYQHGFLRYAPEHEQKFIPVTELPLQLNQQDVDIFRLTEFGSGQFLYVSGQDTGYAERQNNGQWLLHQKTFTPYTRSGTRALVYARGAVWLGVANGEIYRFDSSVLTELPVNQDVAVRWVKSLENDSFLNAIANVNSDDRAVFPAAQNSLRIGFSLGDYSSTAPVMYRTLFHGGNREFWTAWSTENKRDLSHLSGGNYALEIEAKDPWGRVSSATYQFELLYPWYLTHWAVAIYVILGLFAFLGFAYAVQKYRTKRLIADNLALEFTVSERTREVKQKVLELEQQRELKDHFFSNVSHEFRTPLTLTINPLEMLLTSNDYQLPKEERQLASTALSNAKKMLALVGQVLDMNRLELGKLPISACECDVNALLAETQQRFKPWAEQNQQSIELVVKESNLLLNFDKDQIEKCLANLLSNAIKYSGSGSKITIATVAKHGWLGIEVSDNGVGIAKEFQHKVFERYFQDPSYERQHTQGTGIGLALVKEIMTLHGGKVTLDGEKGQGSRFTLWFDLVKNKTLSCAPPYSEELNTKLDSINRHQWPVGDTENAKNAVILIVDDNKELRHFISLRLSASYQVIEADNGNQGFTMALEHQPNLIISDVSMPLKNGFEMTRDIRNTPAIANIPIILLTAKATKRDTVTGLECGADDYLTKPFDSLELLLRIKTLLHTKQVSSEQQAINNSHEALGMNKTPDFGEQLTGVIQDNLGCGDLTVEFLASALFMSKETLTRRCKAELSVTPKAFIKQIRMNHACNLLKENKLTVSQIADILGFESLAYFSRVFKQYAGVAPSEYAKRV